MSSNQRARAVFVPLGGREQRSLTKYGKKHGDLIRNPIFRLKQWPRNGHSYLNPHATCEFRCAHLNGNRAILKFVLVTRELQGINVKQPLGNKKQ